MKTRLWKCYGESKNNDEDGECLQETYDTEREKKVYYQCIVTNEEAGEVLERAWIEVKWRRRDILCISSNVMKDQ